ncbi:MAG: hypothetical protein ACXWEW_09015, partial [Nitrososphaeraceae archaeon]
VETIYQWPIETALEELRRININIDIKDNASIFEKTISMRESVQKILEGNITPEDHNKYIVWIIKNWGQIKGIKDADSINLIEERVQKLDRGDPFRFDKVASWSKYFAFKYPSQYAIYDTRVIYSLNWLLFQAGEDKFYPCPEGRNSLMKSFDYSIHIFIKKLGFDRVEKIIREDIDNRSPGGKSRAINTLEQLCFIEKNNAYQRYCDLLKEISGQLFPNDNDSLTKTEMILFAIADKDIVKDVMSSLYKLYNSSLHSVKNISLSDNISLVDISKTDKSNENREPYKVNPGKSKRQKESNHNNQDVSKVDKARIIFDDELKKVEGNVNKLVRQNVINRFKNEAYLTSAGAATYYQNLKNNRKNA